MAEQVDYSYKFGTRTPVKFSDPLTGSELTVRTNGMVFVTEVNEPKSREELRDEVVKFAEEAIGNTFLALPAQFNCVNLNGQREVFEETVRIGLQETGVKAHVHIADFRFDDASGEIVKKYVKEHPEAAEAAKQANAGGSRGRGDSAGPGGPQGRGNEANAAGAGVPGADGCGKPEGGGPNGGKTSDRTDGSGRPGPGGEKPSGERPSGGRPGSGGERPSGSNPSETDGTNKPEQGSAQNTGKKTGSVFSITPKLLFCRECGRRLSEGDKFCRNCGAGTEKS